MLLRLSKRLRGSAAKLSLSRRPAAGERSLPAGTDILKMLQQIYLRANVLAGYAENAAQILRGHVHARIKMRPAGCCSHVVCVLRQRWPADISTPAKSQLPQITRRPRACTW